MGATLPYSQIVGPAKVYLAPVGTAEPAVNTTPPAPWIEFGPTEGEQSIKMDAKNTYWSDNDHQGDVLARTPEAIKTLMFTLVNMTQEMASRILHNVSNITTAAGPPATSKMPSKPGYVPTEYAILIRGDLDSPYGQYPGHDYTPRGVFEKTLELKRGKTQRHELACEFHALEDDTQVDSDRLGWQRVQTS